MQVIDIEEMAWAPKYGLKGMIDASLRIKFESNTKEVNEIIMPLEFKTGKGTKGQASLSSLLKFCVRGISKWDLDYESFVICYSVLSPLMSLFLSLILFICSVSHGTHCTGDLVHSPYV